MKQLSVDLNNILNTAKTTECVPVEQKYFLTKEDGKMIIETLAQSEALGTIKYTEEVLTLWKQLANLPKLPRQSFDLCGYDKYCSCIAGIEDITEKDREVLGEILKIVFEPISKREFALLYAKLKVLCKWHSVPADEKVIMAAYYDELLKYPAFLVRKAMQPQYEWFPSYVEIENKIKEDGEYILLLKDIARKR